MSKAPKSQKQVPIWYLYLSQWRGLFEATEHPADNLIGC